MTLEDQKVALANIKSGYERIQADYREACDRHSRHQRRNSIQGPEAGTLPAVPREFDSTQELQGELYKLNMQLDDMEQRVGENVASMQNSNRVPFQVGRITLDIISIDMQISNVN